LDLRSNLTEECRDGWVYDRRQVGDSLTEDWDLVCQREGLRATVGAAPMAGYLVGKAINQSNCC
jgi:hypothetical protein